MLRCRPSIKPPNVIGGNHGTIASKCITGSGARCRSRPDNYSEKWLFGEVWERPGLKKRDRSLIVVATLIALGRERQLPGHLNRALDNGVTKQEISEIITHLAFYAGWPAAMTGAAIAKDVFEKR